MRVLILILLAAVLYGTPVFLYETAVQPQLETLQYNYANAEATALQAAGL